MGHQFLRHSLHLLRVRRIVKAIIVSVTVDGFS